MNDNPRGRPGTRPSTSSSDPDFDEGPLFDNRFGGDDSRGESTCELQPGVWWKDENKWVRYNKHIATRIMKAAEVGVLKVKFNRDGSAYSQYVSGNGPRRSESLDIDDFMSHRRSYSSDSSSGASSNIGAPECEVDLVEMKEVHLETGIRRDIKIVRVSVIGCRFSTSSTANYSSAKFSIDVGKSAEGTSSQNMLAEKYRIIRKDEIEGWVSYNADCQRVIWSAWTQGYNFHSMERLRSEKYPERRHYIIDFQTMKEKDVITGHRTPIKIAMWISSSQFPHMWIEEDFKYLTRELGDVSSTENEIMLHKLTISRLLRREYVKRAISENMEPQTLQSLEMSTHQDLAKNGHWNLFLRSFMEIVKEIPDYYGHLWRFALNPNGHHHPDNPFTPRNSNNLWRFVFVAPSHGHDADVLLRSSPKSLPSKYGTHIDWFGLTSTITEFHCKVVSHGVVSMLVFLVLMPKNFDESREKVLFINKIKDHLPVASITLRVDDSTMGPACLLWEDTIHQNRHNSSSSSDSTNPPESKESVAFRPYFNPGNRRLF